MIPAVVTDMFGLSDFLLEKIAMGNAEVNINLTTAFKG
jgi:hypothetical protein